MKILQEILKWLGQILGLSSAFAYLKITDISINYVPGQKTAKINLTLVDISVVTNTILTAITNEINSLEKVATIDIEGNNIVIIVNV